MVDFVGVLEIFKWHAVPGLCGRCVVVVVVEVLNYLDGGFGCVLVGSVGWFSGPAGSVAEVVQWFGLISHFRVAHGGCHI